MQHNFRRLLQVRNSESVTDGDGVRIQRNLAHKAPHTFDPFLMLDEIISDQATDYIGGFPEHPHRGFETVTYMLEGRMRHRDHLGNEGLLVSGGVQWMTAGRGVLHSEMPEQTSGRLHGFQLWVNLPAQEKMQAPRYQDFSPESLPVIDLGRTGSIKLIAGSLQIENHAARGPVRQVTTEPDLFDIQIHSGQSMSLPTDADKRILLYVYEGQVRIEDDHSESQPLSAHQLGLLSDGDELKITATETSRLLLLGGRPIGEPVVQWGPFVMNTQEEIEQAIDDYRHGKLVANL